MLPSYDSSMCPSLDCMVLWVKNSFADKTFVVAGHFPEGGGGDPNAPGVANIKIMIESFWGKLNTSFTKIRVLPRRK